MSEEKVEKMGEILVRVGAMTEKQVKDVLWAQKVGDKRLFGEIAIELGYINKGAVRRYLDQKKRLNADRFRRPV